MTKYDFTFLLNQEAELKTIKELISSLKGKITKEDNWGEKTLAFPIKKNKTANFYNWQIELETKNVKEFKKKLNYNEKLIRYLLLVNEN